MSRGDQEELRSLHDLLADELRGQVRARYRPPAEGALGPVLEAVEVALGPGGAVTVVAGSVVAWLRHRRGSLVVKLRRGERTVEISAQRVRDLTPESVRELTAEVLSALEKDEK